MRLVRTAQLVRTGNNGENISEKRIFWDKGREVEEKVKENSKKGIH